MGGYLAGINGRYACIATAVCVVFYLIAFILIPEPERKAKASERDTGVKVKFRMSRRTCAKETAHIVSGRNVSQTNKNKMHYACI
jgi:hypothetical protein